MTRIAVIGAGIAGLAAAQRLARAGAEVRVFEKARGVGGRMATRRAQTAAGAVQFDHGAQFFTARDPAFRALVETWVNAGAAAPWAAPFAKLTANQPSLLRDEARFVGAPGMSAAAKALANGLDVALNARVAEIVAEGARWRLTFEDLRAAEVFDIVLTAMPAEQTAMLLQGAAPGLAAEAAQAVTTPCWAGLFAFAAPVAFPFEALRLGDHAVLDWIGVDSAKPGRDGALPAFVVHARPDWSRAHLEESADAVAAALRNALSEFFDTPGEPIYAAAHRWRYAQVERPIGQPFAWDANARIGACGDWRLGPRVELAFASGDGLGAHVGAMLRP